MEDWEGRGRDGRGGGRGRYTQEDLTTGSIPKKLWGLSWPQVLEAVLNIADQMVDLFWAGRLPAGFRSIAGLGVAQSFTQFGGIVRQGIDRAMGAMVSRAVGAGNIPLANHIWLQAFTLEVVYYLLMVIIGQFLTDFLLRAIGASEAVQAEGAMYMRIQFIGMATISFRQSSGAALQASGDVITPLKATTLTRITHIVITPFLMFGWWWFPSFGLAGAAMANVFAQLAGCALNLGVLFLGRSLLHPRLRDYRLDFSVIGRLIKIGTPAAMTAMERSLSQLVLLAIVAPFGDVAVAAYALTRRVEMFANFGSMGVGLASGIMAGQNLGAGRPERARQSVAWGLIFVVILKAAVGTLLFLFPAPFVMIFTSQAEVVALTSVWLQILAVASLFLGIGAVFQQSFNMTGATLSVMLVTFFALIAIELPLAWLLSHGLGFGPLGLAWAHLVGMALRAICFVPLFFWGRWLRVKVI